jgi:hypothetical protein
MANQLPQADLGALNQALATARLHLDDATRRLPQAGGAGSVLDRIRSAADNNSSCNTACSCGGGGGGGTGGGTQV